MKSGKSLKRIILECISKLLWNLFSRQSVSTTHKMGVWLGRLLHRLGIRRNVVERNYEIFANYTNTKYSPRSIGKVYENVAGNIFECPSYAKKHISELMGMINYGSETETNLQNLKNTGGLILTGHIGNWELFNIFLPVKLDKKYASFGMRINNDVLLENIKKQRSKYGTIHLNDRKTFLRKSLVLLGKGYTIGLMCDQHSGSSNLFVDFFGISTSFPKGLGFLAFKSRCPVYFASIIKTGKERYDLNVDVLDFERDALDKDVYIPNLAAAYNKKLETLITGFPEQYFWFHKKYKYRPHNEPGSFY